MQLSVRARNNLLDSIETTMGASPKLRFYSGAAPANCAAAASGTMLAELPLPADFMAAASNGTKALSGTWQAAAAAAGTVGHYRIYDNAGTNCDEQGTVTATGGGGDITLDNLVVAVGQTITITSKTLTAPNA